MGSKGSSAFRRGMVLVAAVGLVAGCSDSSSSAGGSVTTAKASTASVSNCSQKPTRVKVPDAPVADAAHDHVLTSFDGTKLRVHWFPLDTATASAPAPTVLMGPGWSLKGDTDLNPDQSGPGVLAALTIPGLQKAGYNVLTWDPRGFGDSTGVVQVDSAGAEGRDTQTIIDWVSTQKGVELDRAGDPRLGMVGFSYGGGIQLVTAAIDCRVDAIVPGIAWNSLITSLYKNETPKSGWSKQLVDAGSASGHLDPHVLSAAKSGSGQGDILTADVDWFRARGPANLVDRIRVPTLFVQGTVDTLFTLDEAIANQTALLHNKVPTSMLWFCGGHGICLTDAGDKTAVPTATIAWMDHYVKRQASVDLGPGFRLVDQDGTAWTADAYPTADASIEATGSGTLKLQADGGSGPAAPPAGGTDVVGNISYGITPAVATNSVDVAVDGGSADAMAVFAPKLSLTYSGTTPDGSTPTRVFAQLVDDTRHVVVDNQITPVQVTLDGKEHTASVDLETIAQHITPGTTLTLQLVASTVAYAVPRLGGTVTFSKIALTIPTTSKMPQA